MGSYCSSHGETCPRDSASKDLEVYRCQFSAFVQYASLFNMLPLFHHLIYINLFSHIILPYIAIYCHIAKLCFIPHTVFYRVLPCFTAWSRDLQGKGRAEQIRRPGWGCWPLSRSSLATDATEISTDFDRQWSASMMLNYKRVSLKIVYP